MKKFDWKPLLIAVLIPVVLIGGGTALATMGAMTEYGELNRPPLSPPGWLFPVVWNLLFIMMGIASYLVWKNGGSGRLTPLTIYGVQLVVNFLWSLVFFNMKSYWLAFAVLLVLWVLILVTIAMFAKVNKAAAWLLVPYLLWVTFAAYLNIGVALLN